MKILIVRFSSIGDIVLTSSVVRALKQQIPNVELHYITKKQFAPILIDNPHIQKVYSIEKSIEEVLGSLQNEKYDWLVDLHHNLRTAGLKRKLGVKSTSFNKLNIRKFLLVKFKIDRMPKLHVVERYFKAVEVLGVKNDHQPGDYFITENDKVDTISEFGLEPKSYIAIAIGAQFKTKQMPVDLLVDLIEKIKKPVVLVGGIIDRNAALEILSKSSNRDLINTCGDYNLNQSASIVKQSAKLLTNDTGMMHIAACMNIPIVSVWGNTTPSLGMFPYYPNQPNMFSIHEVEGLSCRPCSKIGYQTCPKKHFKCMNDQNLENIGASLND